MQARPLSQKVALFSGRAAPASVPLHFTLWSYGARALGASRSAPIALLSKRKERRSTRAALTRPPPAVASRPFHTTQAEKEV